MSSLPMVLAGIALALQGCARQSDSESAQNELSARIFSDSISEFAIQVLYEPGAEPYTGALGLSGNDTWDITKTSYETLFQNHTGRAVSVPSTAAQMTQISDQGKASWSSEELLELGDSVAPALTSGSSVRPSVIFLNGTYDGSTSILGVHFSGRRYAFVFKDVVSSVGGTSLDQKYVEQATVVHELGHTAGFVNHGVPMVSDHEDSDHSHHTINDACVMYWAVESASGILDVLADVILGGRLNLFGSEVLQDGQSYHPH